MPSSSEDLTFARITSEGKGRKTVSLKTTMGSKSIRRLSCPDKTTTLTCIPEETVPIPDFTFSCLCHVEYANAEADILKDAVGVFLVELVDEGLFWR
jgi:hypothetical protein